MEIEKKDLDVLVAMWEWFKSSYKWNGLCQDGKEIDETHPTFLRLQTLNSYIENIKQKYLDIDEEFSDSCSPVVGEDGETKTERERLTNRLHAVLAERDLIYQSLADLDMRLIKKKIGDNDE